MGAVHRRVPRAQCTSARAHTLATRALLSFATAESGTRGSAPEPANGSSALPDTGYSAVPGTVHEERVIPLRGFGMVMRERGGGLTTLRGLPRGPDAPEGPAG